MALINCPECNAEVSDKAKQCPKCAYPLIEEVQEVKFDANTKDAVKEGCFLQTMNTGCLIIVGGILGIIILFMMFSMLG